MSSRSDFVRWLFDEAWSQGRTEGLPDLLPPLTFHYGGMTRQTDGTELAEIIRGWREGFPDLRFTIVDLVEQGDRIAVLARLQGTQVGRWRALPPSGREMDVDVAMFLRWEGDRLVELWEVDDTARRDQQLRTRDAD